MIGMRNWLRQRCVIGCVELLNWWRRVWANVCGRAVLSASFMTVSSSGLCLSMTVLSIVVRTVLIDVCVIEFNRSRHDCVLI